MRATAAVRRGGNRRDGDEEPHAFVGVEEGQHVRHQHDLGEGEARRPEEHCHSAGRTDQARQAPAAESGEGEGAGERDHRCRFPSGKLTAAAG